MNEAPHSRGAADFTLVSVSPLKTEGEVPAIRRLRLQQQADKQAWVGLTLDFILPPLGLKSIQSEFPHMQTLEHRSNLLLRDLNAELGQAESCLTFSAPTEGQMVKDAAPQNTYSKGTYLLTQDLMYRVYQTDARLVRSVLELGGFSATDSHDWNILWANSSPKSYLYEGLNEHQRINHFPRSNEITRKDFLCANLVKMQATYGKEMYDFFPDTFLLPDEFADFCSEFSSDSGSVWIVKPSASSQGRGIFLVDNLVDVPLDEGCVISRYISNPLLLNSLKFDLRIYVLVSSFDPLRIYVYQEGLTRFASESYNPNSASSRYMFLTNYSVNKRNANFIQNENPEKDDVGHKWSLSALFKHLESVGIDTNLLWGKIYDLIIKTIVAIDPVVNVASRKLGLHRSNCFDLFGFDVLIDSNLKPWLLEVNLSPSLATDSPLDLTIKGNLIADTFSLVGLRGYDRKKEGTNRARSRIVNSSMIQTRKSSSLPPSAYIGKRSGTDSQPSPETYMTSPKFRTILKETLEEFSRRGRYVRIFPAPGSNGYNRFFPILRTSNYCLYEVMFGGNSQVRKPVKTPASRMIIRAVTKKSSPEPGTGICPTCGQASSHQTCPAASPAVSDSSQSPGKITVSGDDVLMEYISRLAHTLRELREDALKPQWKRALERFLTHHAWLTSDQRRTGTCAVWERLEARVIEMRQRKARMSEGRKPDLSDDYKSAAVRALSSLKLERVLRSSMKNVAHELVSCLIDADGQGLLTSIIKWLAEAANRQETKILAGEESRDLESGEDTDKAWKCLIFCTILVLIMWRQFATRKPEFQIGLKSLQNVKTPLGLPADKPFMRSAQAEKLKDLLRTQSFTPGVQLSESVKQFARKDKEFNKFLQEFQNQDEPQWSSILEASKPPDFAQFEKDFSKSPKQRLDELHMHEQLRKRSVLHAFNDEMGEEQKTSPEKTTETLQKQDFGMNLSKLIDFSEFRILFLHAGTTTNVTALQRVNQRRVLLYMGNCDGIISYGQGKGWEYSTAYNNAVSELKRNVVAIPLDQMYPCTRFLYGNFHSVQMRIWPSHSGRIKGNPLYMNMLMLAGLRNCQFQVTGRNRSIYNIVHSMYDALLRTTTPKHLAETVGSKVYEMTFGRPTKLRDLGLIYRV